MLSIYISINIYTIRIKKKKKKQHLVVLFLFPMSPAHSGAVKTASSNKEAEVSASLLAAGSPHERVPQKKSSESVKSKTSGGDVLFVGGLSATMIGYAMQESSTLERLSAKGASISLSMAVHAASEKVAEVFGAKSPSSTPPHPQKNSDSERVDYSSSSTLSCAEMAKNPRCMGALGFHRSAFVPVLLKTSSPLEMTTEEWRECVEKDEASATASNGNCTKTAASSSSAKDEKGHASAASAKEGHQKEEAGYFALSSALTLHLHLPSTSSSTPIPITATTVRIRSAAYQAKKDLCSVVRLTFSTASLPSEFHPSGDDAPLRGKSKKSNASNNSSSRNNSSRSPAAGQHTATEKTRSGNTSVADEEFSISVALRVISVGGAVGSMVDADAELQKLLGGGSSLLSSPLPSPSAHYRFLARHRTPYGAVPLLGVFYLYHLFCEHSYYASTSSFSSRHHPYMLLDKTFWCDVPDLLNAEASFPHRWNAVTHCRREYLDRDIIGDMYATPLLLTLSHCTNLRHLSLPSNRVGDLTCARAAVLFSHHRCLSHLDLQGNEIYESGAEALLRLVRRNQRIVMVNLSGNPSEHSWVQQRIEKLVAQHANLFQNDPLNVFSPSYHYLTSPASLPPSVVEEALLVWAHLTFAPIGDVVVWQRNSTTEDMDQYVDESILPRLRDGHRMAEAPDSIIPLVAKAPLLSELMRTVYKSMHTVVPDTTVRSIFMDVAQMEDSTVLLGPTTFRREGNTTDGDGGSKGEDEKSGTTPKGTEGKEEKKKEPRASTGHPAHSLSSSSTTEDVACAPLELWAVLQLDEVSKQVGPRISADDLYSISFLRIIVTTLRALEHHFEWEHVIRILKKVGQKQVNLGARLEDYWLAIHVFMRSLQVSLEGFGGSDGLPSIHNESSLGKEAIFSFLVVVALGLRAALSDNPSIMA